MSESTRTAPGRSTTPQPSGFDSTDATARDRVWDATLDLLARRPLPFQAWRVRKRAGLDESHDRTIRRTLTVMEEAGWLEHDDGSPWWYPGEKTEEWLEE